MAIFVYGGVSKKLVTVIVSYNYFIIYNYYMRISTLKDFNILSIVVIFIVCLITYLVHKFKIKSRKNHFVLVAGVIIGGIVFFSGLLNSINSINDFFKTENIHLKVNLLNQQDSLFSKVNDGFSNYSQFEGGTQYIKQNGVDNLTINYTSKALEKGLK